MELYRAALHVALGVALALASCASSRAEEAPQPVSNAPAAALTRLAMLSGTWESRAQAVHAATGETLVTSARSEAQWDLNGRFLRVRTTLVAPEDAPDAERPQSTAFFTWDPIAQLYRTWTFHSSGEVAAGSMSFDEASRTWNMSENWWDLDTGAAGKGSGAMRFVAEDEKEISWLRESETDSRETYRVQGQSRRLPN